MTNEEMERAIEFLLRNQANFDARMDRLEAAMAASHERSQQQLDQTQQQLDQTQQQLDQTQQRQDRTQRQLDHLSEVVGVIAAQQQRNSEDISVLARMVNTLVEDRNGGAARG